MKKGKFKYIVIILILVIYAVCMYLAFGVSETREREASTTILVGKKASIDGTTMIARNDDTFRPITPQKFIIEPARHGEKKHIKSWLNKFEMDLPEDAQRVPAVPNVDYKKLGYYDESGINQKNVAMSCTESTYGNERTLAFDPLSKKLKIYDEQNKAFTL